MSYVFDGVRFVVVEHGSHDSCYPTMFEIVNSFLEQEATILFNYETNKCLARNKLSGNVLVFDYEASWAEEFGDLFIYESFEQALAHIVEDSHHLRRHLAGV